MAETVDSRFLAAAIRLGACGLGTTWPNPSVGAILVKDGKVVGRGRTAAGGRPHAEPQALARAGAAARGAKLYASLEPCAHEGRTPPCADAVIAAGVARVVMPLVDPDPRVAGRGIERLKAAGIDVTGGLLAKEAARAHAGHLRQVQDGRPHVFLKLAVSADDAIGREGERQVAVTRDIARRHAQALRSRFDAILVGRRTVEIDDPELTCRLPGLEARSPVRVVLDSEDRLAQHRRIFEGSARTWILTAATDDAEAGNVRRLKVARGEAGLDLNACLSRLADEGITRLLVEGGARLARTLLETDLVDEVMLFRSSTVLRGEVVPALAGLSLESIESSPRFRPIERLYFGADWMTRYERVH